MSNDDFVTSSPSPDSSVDMHDDALDSDHPADSRRDIAARLEVQNADIAQRTWVNEQREVARDDDSTVQPTPELPPSLAIWSPEARQSLLKAFKHGQCWLDTSADGKPAPHKTPVEPETVVWQLGRAFEAEISSILGHAYRDALGIDIRAYWFRHQPNIRAILDLPDNPGGILHIDFNVKCWNKRTPDAETKAWRAPPLGPLARLPSLRCVKPGPVTPHLMITEPNNDEVMAFYERADRCVELRNQPSHWDYFGRPLTADDVRQMWQDMLEVVANPWYLTVKKAVETRRPQYD